MRNSKKTLDIDALLDRLDKAEQRIAELEQLVTEKDKRIKELESELERVRKNSRNSSKPPSSDGPEVAKPGEKPARRKRKRGGQKGHKPHLRSSFPPEEVTEAFDYVPDQCAHCHSVNVHSAGDAPRIHQICDLPPIRPIVHEHRLHSVLCGECGEETVAALPDDACGSPFGPGVVAAVGVLTGILHLSKRRAQAAMEDLFNIPISLGGLSACEKRMSQALEAPAEEIGAYIRQQGVAHADETSWRRGNNVKGWLWALVAPAAAYFMVQARRNKDAAEALLGNFSGILVVDRWNAYRTHQGLWQACWAHLKRDFTAISERSGEAKAIGKQLLEKEGQLFTYWHKVRDGTMSRATLQRKVMLLKYELKQLLEFGTVCDNAKTEGTCKELLKVFDSLWTFVYYEGVEPTNNTAERAVRPGVLWRKSSFGTQSERGARYVERALTVYGTCRRQRRSAIHYIRDLYHAYSLNQPLPSLIPYQAFVAQKG